MIGYKPTINNYVDAILARDSDTTYPEVLQKYRITPNGFYMAVEHKLKDFIRLSKGGTKKTLEEISQDSQRRVEFFNMGEEFVRRQYDRIHGRVPGETQKRFYYGTFSHSENVEALVYYALTFHNPQLASPNRAEVIQGIKNLPNNLTRYFFSIGLGGLMQTVVKEGGGKLSAPLAILAIFDKAYKRRAKDVSLFSKHRQPYIEIYTEKPRRIPRK